MTKVATILYLNPTSEVGGAEKSLLDLLRCLNKERYHPIVSFPTEGKLLWELRKMGIETKVVAFHPVLSKLGRENVNRHLHQFLWIPWYVLPTITEIGEFIRRRDVDLIVTNGIKCHIIGSMVSSVGSTKLIWHMRDFIETGWLKWILWLMGRIFPERIITNSNAVGSIFSGNGIRETVYNGIDLLHFDPEINGERVRSEFNIGKHTKLIGTIGHFAPLKGFEELIEAMVQVVKRGFDVKLALVGDAIYSNSSAYRQKLVSLVDSNGLSDRVIFAGFRDNIPEILASFDIFVLPSRSEGFGRVNLEAMAMGKPVVSTNVGGIPEVVLQGVSGILVPPANPEGLAHAIIRLLNDSQLRESIGKEGRRRVEEHFSLQAHVQRIEEIYGEVLRMGQT